MRRNIFIAVGLAVLTVGSCKKQTEYVPEKYELSIVDAESGISGEPRTLYVDSEGGVKSVVVRSNVDITCKILDSDWILVADEGDTRALTDNVFSFRILENDSNFDRKGKVLFFNDYYEVADTLRLVQRGHEGLMMIEYSGSCFDALCLEGAGAYALIDWGDSTSGLFGPADASGFSRPASTSASGRASDAPLYKVPAHQYTAPGPKTIEVKSHNCTALTITNIAGISSLDFSQL